MVELGMVLTIGATYVSSIYTTNYIRIPQITQITGTVIKIKTPKEQYGLILELDNVVINDGNNIMLEVGVFGKIQQVPRNGAIWRVNIAHNNITV